MMWTIRLLDRCGNIPAIRLRGWMPYPLIRVGQGGSSGKGCCSKPRKWGEFRIPYLVISMLLWGSMAPLTAPHAAELGSYTVAELLKPCEEGDNDARWGAGKEAECEQFIKGFTGAYIMLADGGKADDVCLPAPGNRPDEIRWAFMKWVYQNFDKKDMPAAQGLMEVVRSKFPCS